MQISIRTCKLTLPPFDLAGLAPPLTTAVLAVPLEAALPGLRMPPPPIGSELGEISTLLSSLSYKNVLHLLIFDTFFDKLV